MPPIYGIQPAFSAGELSPELWGRTDFQKYQSGLKKAHNILIKPTGGAYNRAGFRYIAQAKDSTHPVKCIEFNYSTTQCYVIELGQNYARFYFNGGQVQTSGVSAWTASTAYAVGALVTNGGTTYYCQVANTSSSSFSTDLTAGYWYAQTGAIYEIPTPWDGSDLAQLTFFQSADTVFLLHPNYPIQTMVRNGPTNWVVAPLAFTDGPFMLENTVEADIMTVTAPSWATSTAYAVGDYVSGISSPLASGDLIDNFSEGNYNLWTLVANSFGTSVSVVGAGPYYLETIGGTHGGSALLYTALSGTYGTWGVRMTPGEAFYFSMSADTYSGVAPSGNGYAIAYTSDGKSIILQKINGATVTNIASAQLSSPGGLHYFAVFRNSSGVFTVYADGVIVGGATDTTYTSGSYIFLLGYGSGSPALGGTGLPGQFTDIYYNSGSTTPADTLAVSNYVCLIEHTSGTFSTDLANALWQATPLVGGPGVTLASSLAQFQSGHVGSLWALTHNTAAQVAANTLASGGAVGTAIKCGASWSLITNGTWTGTLLVQMSTDGGITWTTLETFSGANNANFNTSGQTGEAACLIRIATVGGNIGAGIGGTAWSGSVTLNLASNGFDWNSIVKITAVTNATTAVATVIDLVGSNAATWEWSEGAWSTYRGWPSCGTFYQDRLCVAASPSQPDTFWMSQSSDYTNFGVSDPSVDSDSISANLPSRNLNAIQSLSVPRDLIAVTSMTDWAISSSSGVITPTTMDIIAQGQRGASRIQPVIVGLRMILVQPMGTIVRDLAFSIYTKLYDGNYLSLQSNHLFTNYSVVDMRYQQEPDSIAWLVRNDGVLLSMTYMPEQEVVAWTWHDTQGKFEYISSIPAPSGYYNQLWAVVNRGGTRFIELMDQRLASSDPADQFFVDCGMQLNEPIAITGMTSAKPVVVTAPAHGLSNGAVVDIDGTVVGMTAWFDQDGNAVPAPQVSEDASLLTCKTIVANGYVVANATTNTFSLNDSAGNPVDGSALPAYVSGGNVRQQATAVTGLSHLNGYTVAVLANGFVQSQKLVSGGSITLDAGASRVSVGLPYTADIDTLSLEIGQQDGTLQGRKVKIGEVTLRVKDTGGSIQIMQGEHVEMLDGIIPANAPQPGGLAQPLFTGDIPRLPVNSTFEQGAHIWIRQADPLPLTVLAIMPRVAVGT